MPDPDDRFCPCPDPSPHTWRPRDAARCRHHGRCRGSYGEMRCVFCGRCLDHGMLPIPPRSGITYDTAAGPIRVVNHTDWPIRTHDGGSDAFADFEALMWMEPAND